MATEVEIKQRVSSQSNIHLDEQIFDGTTKTLELPKAHGKSLVISMYGGFKLAYTTAPTAKKGGIMPHLIENFEVKDSKGLLKDIKPKDLKDHAKRLTGQASGLAYRYHATEKTMGTGEVLDAIELPAVPASGQYISFHEAVNLGFECDIAQANFLDTLLQYNGKDINTLKIICNKIENLFTGGTGVVISEVDIRIDVNYITMANAGLGRRWKQWQSERKYTAQATKSKIELNSIDSLAGLKIEVTKGPNNDPVTMKEAQQIKFDLSVRKGGVETYLKSDESLASLIVQDTTKKMLMKTNPSVGYMNFISGNLIESAEQNLYNEMNLLVTLPSGMAFDTNNPFNVRVLVDEVE